MLSLWYEHKLLSFTYTGCLIVMDAMSAFTGSFGVFPLELIGLENE